jgi:amino acid transporter
MHSPSQPQKTHRSLGLLQATAINMSNMVGVGPFMTIPLILGAMGGPQAMLGWLLGAVLAICDGLVWAELASTVPVSGGSIEYLKKAYAGTPLARLLPFLFIWQFILSGPLEVASGAIGFGQYLAYLVPLTPWQQTWVAIAVCIAVVALLYRRIETIGRLAVALWIGVVITIALVTACGLPHIGSGHAFDFPSGAFTFSRSFLLGLGAAMTLAMYDFFGYYSVCYVADEVRDASRTIPRSVLISVIVIAIVYLTMNISIISVVPSSDAIQSQCIASDFMARLYGPMAGAGITVLICWTAFASLFALLLGYSRIPYAAARDGYFFSIFARLHPRGDFPHVSLLVLGAVSIVASFFSLDAVITALVCTRILVQFVAQIGAVSLLRRQNVSRSTFRMALYPLPCLIALGGWLFIFLASEPKYILGGLATLAAGILAFGVWSYLGNRPRDNGRLES